MSNINLPRKAYTTDGALADKVIYYIAEGLAENCKWLKYVFGRSERLVTMREQKKIYTPNVFLKDMEYVSLLPDDIAGNYCFFSLGEPQDVELNQTGRQVHYKTPFSLIVWFDFRTIGEKFGRDKEKVKMDLLNVLNNHTHPRYGYFTINRIYEKAENVWNGYSIEEVDNQNMMSPFCGFRFDGEIIVNTYCEKK